MDRCSECGIRLDQQCEGCDGVSYYTPIIFKEEFSMCNENKNQNCGIVATPCNAVNQTFEQTKPTEYNYVADLENENRNLRAQLKVTEEDRDCKAETLLMVEALILEKGTPIMQNEMVIKGCEIFKKYNGGATK